jgi:3-isopropylmalate/(R)-2-methylmalate dehydratase small subunit
MKKFETLTSWAATLPQPNIDTDQIFPGKYLKTVKRKGLGRVAFEATRYDIEGEPNRDFIFNQPPFDKAEILIAGANFGCGSSREHAVWALADLGIRAIISEQFADIFASNAPKNGMLLITLGRDKIAELVEHAKTKRVTIDLLNQVVKIEGTPEKIPFEIDPFDKKCLLEGLDQITLTLLQKTEISTYEARWKKKTPWLYHD